MPTLRSLDALLLRPGVFSQPIRLAWPPSWISHIPFAFWIVDALKPRTFVELGTHSGNSYAAFAQAVQSLELSTACYAVDTWTGDQQAGFYDETVFTDWSALHDRHFGAFSRLVRSTFDDACSMFGDRSIDLLHIDGLHTYEAVSHDFDTWLPKLSDRGVVLLHDINVREYDFGAWRFWEEVKARYPTYAFLHGHGLGIVGAGTDLPPDVRWLVSDLSKEPRESGVVQRFFARLGASLEREWQLSASDDERRRLADRVSDLEALAHRHKEERDALTLSLQQRDAELEQAANVRMALQTEAERRVAAEVRADSEVRHHAEDFDRLREALEQMAQELEERTKSAARLSAVHDRLRSEHDQLRSALEDLEHERAANDSDVTSLRIAAASAARERRVLSHALTSARHELARMRANWTWRVMAPIRRLSGLGLMPLLRARRPGSAVSVLRTLARPRRLIEIRRVTLSSLFDEPYYLAKYDDVRRSGTPGQVHYVAAGAREGRSPHPLFDGAFYLARHADVRASGANPLVHYIQTGAREKRDPHLLFSTRYYLAQHPEIELLGNNPLLHYLSCGPTADASPHPLFDSTFYAEQNPEVVAAGKDPLMHFVEHGGAQGRAPHPLFDAAYYLRQNSDVRSANVNPLMHYLEHVPGEDRDPHPLFDTSYYLDSAPDLVERRVNPLVHFVEQGCREGRRPNPAFDPRWYLEMNPDVAASGQNALEHFVRSGWREGRDPSPEFSTSDYLAAHPDIAATDTNPLQHYLLHGVREGRAASPSRAAAQRLSLPKSVSLRVRGTANPVASMATPTIVCVGHVVPWPPRAGNEYRVLRMLEWLTRQGYRVLLLLAPLPGVAVTDEQIDSLAARVGNVALCDREGNICYQLQSIPDLFRSLAGVQTRRFATLLGERSRGTPREIELLRMDRAFCHDALIETALRVLEQLNHKVLLAQYVWMSRLLTIVQGKVPTLLDTLDVYSLKAGNVVSFGIEEPSLSGAEEASRLALADVVIAIQERERAAMQAIVPDSDVVTVGVDFEIVQTAGAPEPHTVLMVASGNPMNRLGLSDFLRFAWPTVLEQVPQARLMVAGQVGAAVDDDPPQVDVLGVVDDLAPLYARARVVINPVAAGTGLKIKTVEALSHLRPVVTWPSGLDGLPEEIQASMPAVGDWFEFAGRVIGHLQSADLGLDARTEAAVRTYLSEDAAYAALGDRLARAFARGVSRNGR